MIYNNLIFKILQIIFIIKLRVIPIAKLKSSNLFVNILYDYTKTNYGHF